MPSPRALLALPLLALLLCARARAQPAWDYAARTPVTEEVPIHAVVRDTLQTGAHDLGAGRSLKAVVFALGSCLGGHPCTQTSGTSMLYPDGCPASCAARWPGDLYQTYYWLCSDDISAGNQALLETQRGNITGLAVEWYDYNLDSCMMREAAGEYFHDKEGVAIVVRAQGFTFPPQTVLVTDIDSIPDTDAFFWPDANQEVSTNFAMLGSTLVRPTNTYALDHFTPAELAPSKAIVDQINVTLTQDMLDALQLGLSETWVQASVSALDVSKLYDFPEYQYQGYETEVAGGTVWANFATEFDTIAFTMSLLTKNSDDPDQEVKLNSLHANFRCVCSEQVKMMTVYRPTSTGTNVCTEHFVSVTSYECDSGGDKYCNRYGITGWDRETPTTLQNLDGTINCLPYNTTATTYETDVSAVPAPSWTWPASVATSPYPSASPPP